MSYDFMEMRVAPPEGPICDFCSVPDVHWTYPCRDHQGSETAEALTVGSDGKVSFEKMVIDGYSSGGWACCNACHALIERGDRERLATRSAKRLIRKLKADQPWLVWSLSDATAHVRRIHDRFWANREGAAVHHDTPPREDPTR